MEFVKCIKDVVMKGSEKEKVFTKDKLYKVNSIEPNYDSSEEGDHLLYVIDNSKHVHAISVANNQDWYNDGWFKEHFEIDGIDKPLNIIEVMKLEVGTKLKTDVSSDIALEIIQDGGRKYLKLENDFRKIFIDNVLSEGKYWIKKRLRKEK